MSLISLSDLSKSLNHGCAKTKPGYKVSPSLLSPEAHLSGHVRAFPSVVKNPPAKQETRVRSLGTHSSILTWEIPRTEEPGGLQSTGLQRVGHDSAPKQEPPSPTTLRAPPRPLQPHSITPLPLTTERALLTTCQETFRFRPPPTGRPPVSLNMHTALSWIAGDFQPPTPIPH